MKIKFIIPALVLFLFTAPLYAQNTKPDVESRVNRVMGKFTVLQLDKTVSETVSKIFTDFYTAQEKLRDNIQRPSATLSQSLTPQDFQSVRKKNEKIIEDRDNRLKKILTPDQYKKWTDEIEPSLRTKR